MGMEGDVNRYVEFQERYHNLDVSKYKLTEGYTKLEYLIKDFSNEEKKVILNQYICLLHSITEEEHSLIHDGEVYAEIIKLHPEIVSVYDIIRENKAYFKYIWTLRIQDEKYADEIFDRLNMYYKKFLIENDIIVYVINQEIKDSYNKLNLYENLHKSTQQYGYKPFEEFERMMLPHGMAWYTCANPSIYFPKMCQISSVRKLSIGDSTDGWSREGYREDLKRGFRSSWEANIARILNYKNLGWQYEEKTFELKPPKYYSKGVMRRTPEDTQGFMIYMPDFVLEDGTIIEVKGFWDNRSRTKVSQFMEQYPNEKYLVIDVDIYRCLALKYKDIISNWEDDTVGASNDEIQVVGITIPERVPFVKKLMVGDSLIIEREPENTYDSKAIKVMDSERNHVGYFAKDCNCIYAPKMDMGFRYKVKIKVIEQKVLQCKIALENKSEMIVPENFL